MRSHPELFRLSFLLPDGVKACPGSHQPSPHGCRVNVTAGSLVEITGPSREATFEHCAAFFRVARRATQRPFSIAATLVTPIRPAGRDSWSIIVGADVAFSPTSLDPHFPEPESPRVALGLVVGARGG